jgi:hypothetical protein
MRATSGRPLKNSKRQTRTTRRSARDNKPPTEEVAPRLAELRLIAELSSAPLRRNP